MVKKLQIYLLGLFILSIGSNLFINAALGVSPSCSLALTLTYLLPGSYAFFNFIVNSFCLILEAILIKSFGKTQFVQLGITFIYSYLIKITSIFLTQIQPHTIIEQILVAVIACFIMALGIELTIDSNLTVMPYEGLVGALSYKLKISFGKLKVIADIVFTLSSILLSLLLLHNLNSVGLGTIIASFLTGSIVSLYAHFLAKRITLYIAKPLSL